MTANQPAVPDADAIEAAVLAAVDSLGVDYQVVRIDPAAAATADFCARYGYDPDSSANCIVVAGVRAGTRSHAACVVQATRRLDVNGLVRRRLGARKASFAPAEETVALTGMVPDGVTPFGLPDGLPLWVDAGVMAHERVIVGGGSRALKLEVPTATFERVGAEVVEGLAR